MMKDKMRTVKSELPEGWVNCEFGDIAKIRNGYAFKSSWFKNKRETESDVPLIRQSQLKKSIVDLSEAVFLDRIFYERFSEFRISKGDILIGMSGAIGKVCTYTHTSPSLQNQRMGKIELHAGGKIDLKFLGLFLSNIERALLEKAKGMGVQNISGKDICGLPFPMPPFNEQRRIVVKIEELFSELDKGIESLKAARAKLNVYRQAVLKHAFEGKLTAHWREENKDKLETPEQLLARIKQEREARYEQQLQEWKAAVKKWEEGGKSGKRPARSRMPKPVSTMAEEEIAHLESLPSGWLWLTAESVGIVQLGRQRSPKNRSKDYPTKYIRAANITEQGLDLDDVLDMDFLPHELSAYRLEKGDLVLSEASGSAAQVGKPAIWDDQIPDCCFQNTVIRHQPYCRDYAAYLLWLYRFFYVSGKFAQVAGGVGINHLSAFKFAQIALPLCSLAEQQEIVRLLEERFVAIEQQEREINSALNQAEMLRQSILKNAFSGQLVPQDPDDEPASILLERIKAEKAARSQNNTRAKRRRTTATA